MFDTQKSGNKTSSEEVGPNIRTHASHKVGRDQVSKPHPLGGYSTPTDRSKSHKRGVIEVFGDVFALLLCCFL